MASTTAVEIESVLAGFHGGEEFFRHPLNRKVLWTEGVAYLADSAGAYWLLDEIAIANLYERAVKAEEFQVWTLALDQEGSGAVLKCGDGNGNAVYSKAIPFTDFPLQTIDLYFENDVICLPAER